LLFHPYKKMGAEISIGVTISFLGRLRLTISTLPGHSWTLPHCTRHAE
jgi:hypothetical protein